MSRKPIIGMVWKAIVHNTAHRPERTNSCRRAHPLRRDISYTPILLEELNTVGELLHFEEIYAGTHEELIVVRALTHLEGIYANLLEEHNT